MEAYKLALKWLEAEYQDSLSPYGYSGGKRTHKEPEMRELVQGLRLAIETRMKEVAICPSP